jgi:methylated-DNA-protein-cysteine methyltransferase related protein
MIKKKFGTPQRTFSDRVIALALSIPKGKVMTYGSVARCAGGGVMASQSITAILGKAYDRGVKNIPFHRIVYADGRVWMDAAHRQKRLGLYAQEKIRLDSKNRIIDLGSHLFEPHSGGNVL